MSKRVLVTGGAGFVGSHLCEALVKRGDVVFSLDNYSTGSKANHIDGVYYTFGDTKDISKYNFGQIDMIYHLGEYSRVEESYKEPNKVFDFNTFGTYEVIKFALDNNCRLLYAGSSTKFGNNGADSSPYAFSKAMNTQLVKNYGSWYGLDYVITYFYNVYGPREISSGSYATVIAKFNELRKQGVPLPVTTPGTQVRNFTHVEDIVAGLLLAGDHGIGDGYGIGADESFTILDVAKMFECDVEMTPPKRGNRLSAELVTQKIKTLGWRQNKYLKDYIVDLIK
jgi:UDP-glucose 4-epimerase